MKRVQVNVNGIKLGGGAPLVLIAGPCVIESEKHCFEMAKQLKGICEQHRVSFIFKTSYDKANRSSIDSYRGPGLEKGIKILRKVKEQLGVSILTDVHCSHDVERVAEVADIIQIPAFLSRQTDLLMAVAKTGRVVNVKKGQFLAPWDVVHVFKKIEKGGNRRILLTERGVSFGYNNLVSDMRSLAILRSYPYPVVYDATHSVQLPGGKGSASGGNQEFVPHLSRAAVGVGCDALFWEVHDRPEKALSDGANALKLREVPDLLKVVLKIDRVVKATENHKTKKRKS